MNINKTFVESTQTQNSNQVKNIVSKSLEVDISEIGNQEGRCLSGDSKGQNSNLEERKKAIIDAIEKASGKIEIESKGLEFSIHKQTNQIMIKVIDNNTHEVIKEVPSEKILDMMAKIVELSGNFIDERR